jgi:hypothetical protein
LHRACPSRGSVAIKTKDFFVLFCFGILFRHAFAAELRPGLVFAAGPGLKIREQQYVLAIGSCARWIHLFCSILRCVALVSTDSIRQSKQGTAPVDCLLASIRAGAPSLAVFRFSVRVSRALGPSLAPAPVPPFALLILSLLPDFAQAHEA